MVETSLSWVPGSSWYCSHRSVSIISAAASQRRMAASPRVRWPLLDCARADGTFSKIAAPAVTAAPATTLFLRNARRLNAFLSEEEPPSPEAWFDCEGVRSAKLLNFIIISFLCSLGFGATGPKLVDGLRIDST